MKCIEDPYEIYGDYSSAKTANLLVLFVKCDPRDRNDCKSDDEIKQWLKFKYLITLQN